ncbi:MAG: dephospho-CoA kinase [Bacteroides sp.]|nr:dephospho-CoA kinase [Bacillota bacterium]MCM1393960.1 dephospho-CoA kinase [[Eubacterium] siraeum]MCM1455131.1 dephospho-CoA kinase [Bacteroides sp.]
MKIAIIGGIGSGKSEALKAAKELGLPTLSADGINDELLENPEYVSQIAEAFPSAVQDGAADRKKLAEIVFSNDDARARINALAHPRILKRIKEDMRDPLVVEMPLLVEIGAEELFDEIVLVYAPLKARIERLNRRGFSSEEAMRRICAQADEDSLKAVATRVLDNSNGLDELRKNVRELFCELTRGR